MDTKAMAAYREILNEIKFRIEAIDQIIGAKLHLRQKIAEEVCYLQLRMICELIAIGCLIIHGDLNLSSALTRSYKADWIINEMRKLHPKFYPEPLESGSNKDEQGIDSWIAKKSGFLSREELLILYNKESGSRLHRGSARNILKNERPIAFNKVKEWRNKIVELLTRHILVSPDEKTICYFIMNNGKGIVSSNIFNKVEDN